jgi:hypothetical protein
MSRAIFNIPIFNIQGVDIALILFPRHIIYNIATKLARVAAKWNNFYMRYVDLCDVPGLLYDILIYLDGNVPMSVDVERFLDTFWVAVYLSDLQFGAPVGAILFADISNSTAFADLKARYPKFIWQVNLNLRSCSE